MEEEEEQPQEQDNDAAEKAAGLVAAALRLTPPVLLPGDVAEVPSHLARVKLGEHCLGMHSRVPPFCCYISYRSAHIHLSVHCCPSLLARVHTGNGLVSTASAAAVATKAGILRCQAPNIYRVDNSQRRVSTAGVVRADSSRPSVPLHHIIIFFVLSCDQYHNLSLQYVPKAEDSVLGVVEDRGAEQYRVNIFGR